MRDRVQRTLAGCGVVGGGRLLVGLSGGPDSLCLLHLLTELAGPMGLELSALHVDHGLRDGSADDAAAAVELAARLGVRCRAIRLARGPEGDNVQQWAREQRLSALASHAGEIEARWVALAHTKDDQAETVLMRVIRGAGPAGLSAMIPARPLARGTTLLRPLLDVRRGEVEAHLAAAGISPLEDPTNRSPVYLRNRVRHQVLPSLAELNPAVVDALCRLAACCAEEHEALLRLVEPARERARLPDGSLDLAVLADLPVGALQAVMRRELAAAPVAAGPVGREHVLALAALAHDRTGTRRVALPGLVAVSEYGRLRLVEPARDAARDIGAQRPGSAERNNGQSRPRKAGPPAAGALEASSLAGPGWHRLRDGRWLEVSWLEPDEAAADPLTLGAGRIGFPLGIRGPRAGDRLTLGVGKRKRISRLLIDEKIPRDNRSTVPLVTLGGEVLMVVGVRRAQGLRPRPGEKGLRVVLRRDRSPGR